MKKKYVVSLVFWWILLFLFGILFFFLRSDKEYNLIFAYPKLSKVNFAWESVPFDGKHFYNKEKFDKEYIITSNTLYQFFLYVKRYPNYIPYIEEKLKENKIPDDFKYLAIAESALRSDIKSTAWANGIWQFMPDTAIKYGLIVNEYVDERNNFEKSTDAAMKYFKDLYADFWNWTLVAAAYNRGENGLRRDMKSQNVTNYYDLYLNEETSRYVFRILAIKYILLDYFEKKHIIDFFIGSPYEVPDTELVKVWEIDDLMKWAQDSGQNYNTIKLLNPWILQDSLHEGTWEIKVLKQ